MSQFRLLVLLFVFGCIKQSLCQQSSVSGTVSIFNSKYNTGRVKYVEFANVSDDANLAQSTPTNSLGQFAIVFVGLEDGYPVQLKVRKDGLLVVNTEDLKVISGQKDSVKIWMAPPGYIEKNRATLYNISISSTQRRLEGLIARQKNQLKSLLLSNVKQSGLIDKYKLQIETLEHQLQTESQTAMQFASRYATVNLDEVSFDFLNAFDLFKKGLLDSADKVLGLNKLKNTVTDIQRDERRLQEITRELEQNKLRLKSKKNQTEKSLQLRADLSLARFDYQEAGKAYKVLLALDSSNFDYWMDYTKFCQVIRDFQTAKFAINKATVVLKFNLAGGEDRASELLHSAVLNATKAEVDYHTSNYSIACKEISAAISAYRELSSLTKQNFGGQLSDAHLTLGNIFREQFNLRLADSAFRIAVEFAERQTDSTDSYGTSFSSLQALNCLATSYYDKNNYDSASYYYFKALALQKNDSSTANVPLQITRSMILNNLGNLFRDIRPSMAREFFTEAIQIRETAARRSQIVYGPFLGRVLFNYAELLYHQSEIDTSIKVLYRAKQLFEELDSSLYKEEIADITMNLANRYRFLKDFSKADSLFKISKKLIQELLAQRPLHFENSLAVLQINIGDLYFDKADFKNAILEYKVALERLGRLAGEEHDAVEPDLALAHYSIAKANTQLGDTASALSNLVLAFNIYKKINQKNLDLFSDKLGDITYRIGFIHYWRREWAKSEISLKNSCDYYKSIYEANKAPWVRNSYLHSLEYLQYVLINQNKMQEQNYYRWLHEKIRTQK